MAITTTRAAAVGDTTPCPACGHVKDPAKRLHEVACCGLESHKVGEGFDLMTMTYRLAHLWREDGMYAAVQAHDEISETDALAWLERAHSGEVERRPYVEGLMIDCDWWEG